MNAKSNPDATYPRAPPSTPVRPGPKLIGENTLVDQVAAAGKHPLGAKKASSGAAAIPASVCRASIGQVVHVRWRVVHEKSVFGGAKLGAVEDVRAPAMPSDPRHHLHAKWVAHQGTLNSNMQKLTSMRVISGGTVTFLGGCSVLYARLKEPPRHSGTIRNGRYPLPWREKWNFMSCSRGETTG